MYVESNFFIGGLPAGTTARVRSTLGGDRNPAVVGARFSWKLDGFVGTSVDATVRGKLAVPPKVGIALLAASGNFLGPSGTFDGISVGDVIFVKGMNLEVNNGHFTIDTVISDAAVTPAESLTDETSATDVMVSGIKTTYDLAAFTQLTADGQQSLLLSDCPDLIEIEVVVVGSITGATLAVHANRS